jgi:hypothetical protein
MKIKYLVNKEKGIVKAISEGGSEYAQGIDPVIAEILIKKYNVKKSDLTLPANIIGIARLHPDDNFDEILGKEIAKERFLIAYNKICGNTLSNYYDGIDKIKEYAKYKAVKSYNEQQYAQNRLNKLNE